MSDTCRVAVVTALPAEYPYRPFAEVAETLHQAALAVGCDSVIGHEFYARRLNIVLGAHRLKFSDKLPRAMVIFNLEPLFPGAPSLDPEYVALLRRFPVWDYSHVNVEFLRQQGIDDAAVMPIGYAEGLTRIPFDAAEDVDVLFYGAMRERRTAILDRVEAAGLHVERRFGVYGAERDRSIARARIVLNLHHRPGLPFEIVRVSYLLANRRFVISERGTDPELEAPFADGVVFADAEEIPAVCAHWAAHASARRDVAERGFRIMQARPQAAYLGPALRALAARFPALE